MKNLLVAIILPRGNSKGIKYKNRFFGKMGVYVMSKINSVQIDDKEDIKIVNSLKHI